LHTDRDEVLNAWQRGFNVVAQAAAAGVGAYEVEDAVSARAVNIAWAE